jgi:hypothetical protein
MSHDAVYLHVGMPKTGTTYLQEFLWTNRKALMRAGVLYPADRPGRQFKAVLDLEGTGFAGNETPDVTGSWEMVTGQAKAWHSRSVISHEIMAGLSSAKIAQALESLAPRRVHVIVTLRDLSRIVPATWQEDAKNRHVESWPDFLKRVRLEGGPRDRRFWSLQDVPTLLGRWAEHIPPEHIHVVTVPPAGSPRHLLLERFARVIDIDPADYKQDVKVANDSIGPVEVALLHRINDASRERLPWPAYHHSIKHYAVPKVLATRPDVTKMALPESELGWVREETGLVVSTVERLGLDVVGDLADLTPQPVADATPDPTGVTERQELEAAVDLSLGFAERIFELNARLARVRTQLDAATERQVTRTEKFKRRIVRVGRHNRQVDALLNAYRRARGRPTSPPPVD